MISRPLMETLRLIIRKWILCERKIMNYRIILNSDPVYMELCSKCAKPEVIKMGPLFFMRICDVRLEGNKIPRHQCILDGTSFSIEYTTKYVLVYEPQNTPNEDFRQLFDDILLKYDKLTHFMRQQSLSPKTDPFTLILERFIHEEHQVLCSVQEDITMNERMLEILTTIESIRMTNTKALHQSNKILSLFDICRIIKELKSYESMQTQIDSIQKSRRLKMKASEKMIERNFTFHNRLFTELLRSNQ